MKQPWQYLQNQFDTVTQKSYKKAVQLSNYHDADLRKKSASEPLLAPIYDRYHPLHLELIQQYNQWKSQGGSQQGQTLNLSQLLQLAVDRVPDWEDDIVTTDKPDFKRGSPNFKAVFPNSRKPFNRSSIDERVNAFDRLARNMVPFPALSEIMNDVASTYSMLDLARDQQNSAKGDVRSGSGKVDDARQAAMTMQWRNVCFCADQFWDRLEYVQSMFDLQTLREGSQRIFTGTLDPLENEAVLVHTFLADDEVRLKSNGDSVTQFYLSNTPNGINSTAVTVNAGEENIIPLSAFGITDYSTYRYLTAINQSDASATQYVVEVL